MSTTTAVTSGEEISAVATIRRGMQFSPELRHGIGLTFLWAVISAGGRVVVPIAVQQALDKGINAEGGVDISFTVWVVVAALGVLMITGAASYKMTSRLFRAAEAGLATLRIKAFRHVHDLPVLTQNTERRGALVARVTTDVDQVSQFLVFGGILFVISVGQVGVATVVMAFYSWQLAVVVWVCFVPMLVSLRWFQARLSAAYARSRHQVGVLLSAIAEPVIGAVTVKSYAAEARTQNRIDTAIDDYLDAQTEAQKLAAGSFSLGGISAGFANAGVVVVGVLLGVEGNLTVGEILAFAFLVNLFVGPIQMGTQVLTDAQNAFAGWRRVIGVLDTPADVADPGPSGTSLPDGPVHAELRDVTFAYPAAEGEPSNPVLHDVSLTIEPRTRVAVVGETGSGKTTIAKLLTRLMDPTEGDVMLDGVDLREVPFDSLRDRVVLVPQEGFLFDDTLRANALYGKLDATDPQILGAIDQLGLSDWFETLPRGLDTRVGQRGESLSAGERQLVALVRAHLANPDLLVLDEATSAVDPALEMRIAAALERLQSGRTSVTIAHRMSTAEQADVVVVVDKGRIVQQGHHQALLAEGGVYGRLHASWVAQQALG